MLRVARWTKTADDILASIELFCLFDEVRTSGKRTSDPGHWLRKPMSDDRPLSILLTNICVAGRSGTEIMTAELSLALVRRKHTVTIYTARLGPLAEELMSRGISVTDRIATLTLKPDIIHGHHNLPLAMALTRFPGVRALFVCHDTAASYDAPLLSSRVHAFVAVDLACAQRLEVEGVPSDRIHVVPNAVDLARFPCRTSWREVPTKALAITKARAPWLPAVREACASLQLPLTEIGAAVDRVVDDLPAQMAVHDVVFAWSRSACEAAATGAAVILCDETGFGGLLSADDAERFPYNTLGRRSLSGTISVKRIVEAIGSYDSADAAAVAAIVRRKLSLEDMTATYERLYRSVLAAEAVDDGATGLAAFLERAFPRYDRPSDLAATGDAIRARMVRLDAWLGGSPDRPATVIVPDHVGFGVTGLGVTMLAHGWASPEGWGTWSDGVRSTLDLPLAIVAAWAGRIEFECKHYFSVRAGDEDIRPVEIWSGTRLIGRWHFLGRDRSKSSVRQALTIDQAPDDELRRGGSLTLRFALLGAEAPIAAGQSPDMRLLGLALIGMARRTS